MITKLRCVLVVIATCMCMGSQTLAYAGEKGVEVGGHIEEHPK